MMEIGAEVFILYSPNEHLRAAAADYLAEKAPTRKVVEKQSKWTSKVVRYKSPAWETYPRVTGKWHLTIVAALKIYCTKKPLVLTSKRVANICILM